MENDAAAFAFHDLKPEPARFLEDVVAGLGQPQKALSPKYFYDDAGSALFERICTLPEYYPTRTELALMERHGDEMAGLLGHGSLLIEYGSGSGRKTIGLIERLKPAAYIPIDISASQLKSFAAQLARRFPALRIAAACADYSRAFDLPDVPLAPGTRRIAYFPGSTIGNFTVEEARGFLASSRALVGRGGAMLIGVDLKKDEALLHAAYNDTQGVTAAFNLNLLVRINRELGADFDLAAFRHRAFYNRDAGRIEMHLLSERSQRVTIAGRTFAFRAGETIHTENSYKYSVEEFRTLARAAGFESERVWIDGQQLFSIHYLAAR